MQWSIGRPFVPPGFLDRLDRRRLRRAALRYAAHGWAVTPGACLTGHRFSCGRPGCPIMTCHPAAESWEDGADTRPDLVAGWWRHRPHTVLLPTGRTFDAVEVPATVGRRALGGTHSGDGDHSGSLTDAGGPIAATAAGRWMFLVRPGLPLRPELERRVDIVRHGRGSWIPAAPSRMFEGPVRWVVSPERSQWRLPAAEAVQARLVAALGSTPRRHATVIPRQLSTARRGG